MCNAGTSAGTWDTEGAMGDMGTEAATFLGNH